LRAVQVRVENLFGQRQRATQHFAGAFDLFGERVVVRADHIQIEYHRW